MHTLASRLRMTLNFEKLTQEQLANSIGKSQNAISLILQGKTKKPGNIVDIAKVLNVDPEWLSTGEGKVPEWLLVKNKNSLPNNKQLSQDAIDKVLLNLGVSLINNFRSINVSAGFGSFNSGVTQPDGYTAYSTDLINSLQVNPSDCAVFWVNGNSMFPAINNGDQLLVDLSQKEISGNNIYLIQSEDSLWVKRIRKSWNGFELISDNSEEYPIIKIEAHEAETLQIVGRVVHVGHSLV